MKKKLCYYLIIVLTLFSFNSVLAEGNSCEGLDESDLPTLHRTAISDYELKKFFGGVFDISDGTYYNMTLDGHRALCLDKGKPARNDDKYEYVGPVTGTNASKALGFYLSSEYPGLSMYKWAIAQYIAWRGWNSSAIQTIIRYDEMLSFKYGYMSEEQKRQMILPMINKHSGETYYIWKNKTRADGQRMITTLKGCNPPTEENPSCPTGEMFKQNDSMSCAPSKSGLTFGDFKYTAGAGEKTNVSYASENGANGEELRQIGSFCKLYCQESGRATLPGAIGESLPLGSYMIWPTSNNNYNNQFYKDYYPLRFEGTLECKIGVIPDKGLPFRCEDDPEADYYDAYTAVKNNRNNGTYNRIKNTTLEKMRLDITTWGASDSIPSSSTIEEACKAAYNKDYTSIQYQYDKAIENMNYAAELLSKARAEENAVEPKQTRQCPSNYVGVPSNCPYTDTDQYVAAKRKTASAQAYYNEMAKIVENIKAGITNCKNYTINFERARQILKEYKTCAEFSADESLYAFSSAVTFNYSDTEYNTGSVAASNTVVQLDGQIEGDKNLIGDEIKSNDLKFEGLYVQTGRNAGVLTDKVNSIQSRKFSITKSESYNLITKYKYVDKQTKKYLPKPQNGTNYSTINTRYGVIPSSYDNKIAKNYYMTLSNISFGMVGFTNASGSDYKCPVQFTKVGNINCVCPEGTKMAGKDLIGLIANNKMTCPDAQLLYCDSDEDPPHEDMYCPNMPDVSIGACVNSGYTKSECIDKICTRKYTCKNTNGVGGKMDITSCVQTKMMQGLTEQQAIDYCDSVVCPIGRTIIYRTIKLENPFPSYDQLQNPYNGLSTGMFNNNTRGRYPGHNWNGILTVYNKIRNNRSGRLEKNESTAINKNTTIGTKIYQTKEPLYTFVLDGGTIKEIRRYNESRKDGYNDFNSSKTDDNMDCKINNSIACVSAFVHNQKYGLKSGECYNNRSKSNFYTCARR